MYIDGFPGKKYDRISLTISSDEPGVFIIQARMAGIPMPGGDMELRMDDLLQAQFNSVTTMKLFDVVVVNVNLLVFLINRK